MLQMDPFTRTAQSFAGSLLRVQSEGMLLQCGCPGEAALLSAGRHSAVWIQGQSLFLRLARRKNRPQGSLLRRGCLCSKWGQGRCPVHRLAPYLAMLQQGQPLWPFNAAHFCGWLHRVLMLLSVEGAAKVTLKAFRAGKATALAEAGFSIGEILRAGEWQSRAFLTHIDEDAVDTA